MNNTSLPILLDKKPQGVVLSASQVNTWDLCKRRWAIEYIWKIKGPPHPSAVLGSKVHKHLERWLSVAQPPPTDKAGMIALAMIPPLPPPGAGVVERRFYVVLPSGLLFTGFIDWSGVGPIIPIVTDHKTSGNLEWALTAEKLHNDVQALLYALVAFVGFGCDTVGLLWNYGHTKKEAGRYVSLPVYTEISFPEVVAKFAAVIEPAAHEMIAHRNAQTDPMSFPPQADACGAYGGCPHRGTRCNMTEQERLHSLMNTQPGQDMASMMQEVVVHNQGNGAAAPLQPGQQPVAQQPGPPAGQPVAQMPQQPQVAPLGSPLGLPPVLPPVLPPAQPVAQQPQGAAPGQQVAQQPQVAPQQPQGAPQQLPGAVPGQQVAQQPQVAPQQPQGALQEPQQAPAGAPVPQMPAGVPPQPQGALQAPQQPGVGAPPPAGGPPQPQGVVPGQQVAQQPAGVAPGQQPQQPAQPYAPEVGPNPPEAGTVVPSTEEQTAAADGGTAKRGPGRPKGAANKTLNVEQQLFLAGVTTGMRLGHQTVQALARDGDLVLEVFKARFG